MNTSFNIEKFVRILTSVPFFARTEMILFSDSCLPIFCNLPLFTKVTLRVSIHDHFDNQQPFSRCSELQAPCADVALAGYISKSSIFEERSFDRCEFEFYVKENEILCKQFDEYVFDYITQHTHVFENVVTGVSALHSIWDRCCRFHVSYEYPLPYFSPSCNKDELIFECLVKHIDDLMDKLRFILSKTDTTISNIYDEYVKSKKTLSFTVD